MPPPMPSRRRKSMPDGSKPVTEANLAVPQPKRRRALRRVLLTAGPLAVALVAGGMYLNGGRYAETDNAYVQTHMISVSADISGRVVELTVHENQHVETGRHAVPDRSGAAADRGRPRASRSRIRAQRDRRPESRLSPAPGRPERPTTITRPGAARIGAARKAGRRQDHLADPTTTRRATAPTSRSAQSPASSQDMPRIISELGGNPTSCRKTIRNIHAAQAELDQAELDLRRGTVQRADRRHRQPGR